jgi:transcriptional regulator with XRE-family HTH domain
LIRESQTFGSRLRAERERRGISLASIAETTKIKKSFLESLERGDFSKWPVGTVFRRAYVRDYAAAIGLSPESVVVDFIRLSPLADEPAVAPPLALTFDTASTCPSRLGAQRVRAAVVDAGSLLALGAMLAFLTGGSVWMASGALAFLYYPATYALWGRSIASRYFDARRERRQIIAFSGAVSSVAGTAEPSVQIPAAIPILAAVGRPEAVVDEAVVDEAVVNEALVDTMLLTAASQSQSPHVPQESTAH